MLPSNSIDLKLVALDLHQHSASFVVFKTYFKQKIKNIIFTTIFATFYFKIAVCRRCGPYCYAEVLQKALRALEQFCADNRLTVNTDESKLMCFAKRRPTMLPTLYYEENQLGWVTEFKYLGVTFSHRNTMADGLEVLCHQAQRAQSVVDLHVTKAQNGICRVHIHLFDVLVKPILTYGSEVYGLYNSAAVEHCI